MRSAEPEGERTSCSARGSTSDLDRAVARYRLRARRISLAGTLGVVPGVALIRASGSFPVGASSNVHRVGVYATCLAAALAAAGLLSGFRALRVERTIGYGPVVMRDVKVSVDPLGNRRPGVLLLASPAETEAVLLVSALRWRTAALKSIAGPVWCAGDPQKYVVLVIPASLDLYVARPPRSGFWRRHLKKAVLREAAPDR